MGFKLRISASFLSLLLLGAARNINVSLDQISTVRISVEFREKILERYIFCYDGIPGTLKTRGNNHIFSSFSGQIAMIKKKDPNSSKIPLLRAINIAGKKSCIAVKPSPSPTPANPLPPPSSTAIPSPTSTPTNSIPGGNFSSSGDVTESGKLFFEIPNDLNANVSRGRVVYQSNCIGCHEERLNYPFSSIDFNIRRPPMLFDDAQISRQQRADLVAYLNRFRFN